MTREPDKPEEELTPEELERQAAEQLPDREVMSTIDPHPGAIGRFPDLPPSPDHPLPEGPPADDHPIPE